MLLLLQSNARVNIARIETNVIILRIIGNFFSILFGSLTRIKEEREKNFL